MEDAHGFQDQLFLFEHVSNSLIKTERGRGERREGEKEIEREREKTN